MAATTTLLRLNDLDFHYTPVGDTILTGTLSAYSPSVTAAPNRPVLLTMVTAPTKKPHSTYLGVKRTFDLVFAAGAFIVLSPALVTIAALIKFTSPGPVFFGHKRVGLNGIPFRCWKFRSMVTDADKVLAARPELHAEFQAAFKIKNDPRVTPLGAILRKTSLDELPQVLNVLLGSMSFIGPRPVVHAEVSKYGEHAPKLVSVKPGIGGLWQSSGRSDLDYTSRVDLDMQYIDRRSFTYDLTLLLRTAGTVLKRRGAY
jgi:exopolysaccharide production protein ExoY